MINMNKIVSQALTGLLGAVIALVAVACVSLVPLRAQSSSSATSCEDNVCVCQSNLKQFGLALTQYTQDYDERYPVGLQGPPSSGVGWNAGIFPYVRGRADLHCPSDRTVAIKPQYALSYGLNSNLPSQVSSRLMAQDLTVAFFELSGTPIYVSQYDEGASIGADVFSGAGNGLDGELLAGKNAALAPGVAYATGRLGHRPFLKTGSQFLSVDGRHYTGANDAFADGHVHFFYPNEISSGTTALSATAPQDGGTTGHAAGTLQSGYKATFSPN